jgi:hypothetical protein
VERGNGRKILYLSSRLYNIQGEVRASTKNDTKEYEDVIPDSIGELMLGKMCSILKFRK